mgnify:CR=1 FL=1
MKMGVAKLNGLLILMKFSSSDDRSMQQLRDALAHAPFLLYRSRRCSLDQRQDE